jgi:5-methylcytosine-specific restriction endonuclease McrA
MLLEFMARAFLQDDPPQNISSAPPCRVTLHSIPEAKLAWIESANGPQYVTEDKLLQALDDCEIIDLREKENPNQNHQEISTWKSDKKSKSKRKYGPHLRKSIPPTVRRKVLERDGNHCCLCHQRLFNQVHHIKPVCQGGNNSPQNLCTVCWVCHEALNKGRLYVEGTAPHGLIWRNAKGDILKSGIALTGSP